MTEHRLSERQACRLLDISRATYRYEPRPEHNSALREALLELARHKPRYGYRRLWVPLTERQGWKVSIGRVHRLHKKEGWMVRRLKRKRLKQAVPQNPLFAIITQC